MKGQKLFYIFKDPFGARECKVGITGNPWVRLGVYQNSYSKKSHTACFDIVYIGPKRAVDNLEKAIKRDLNWDIELDGLGHSEWVSLDFKTVESKIDELIKDDNFKIIKVSKKFLPLSVDNLKEFEESHFKDKENEND